MTTYETLSFAVAFATLIVLIIKKITALSQRIAVISYSL